MMKRKYKLLDDLFFEKTGMIFDAVAFYFMYNNWTDINTLGLIDEKLNEYKHYVWKDSIAVRKKVRLAYLKSDTKSVNLILKKYYNRLNNGHD